MFTTFKISGTASWRRQPLSLWARWISRSCWEVGTLQQWQCPQPSHLCNKENMSTGGCGFSSNQTDSVATFCRRFFFLLLKSCISLCQRQCRQSYLSLEDHREKKHHVQHNLKQKPEWSHSAPLWQTLNKMYLKQGDRWTEMFLCLFSKRLYLRM